MAMFTYRMPELGEGLHEGEIVKWHIKPGDSIQEDDVLMEVQNDKAVVEVPSPVSGTVKEVKVPEGTVAVVGDALAVIEAEGELPEALLVSQESPDADASSPSTALPDAPQAPMVPEPAASGSGTSTAASGATGASDAAKSSSAGAAEPASPQSAAQQGLVLATPSVRKLARDQGVGLTQVRGTGKHGRITREDVLNFNPGETNTVTDSENRPSVTVRTAAEAVEERVSFKGIRKVVAENVAKSAYTAPHVTIMDEVDVSALVKLRQRAKPIAEQKGVKLTYLPFIVKALVAACREYPVLNAMLDEQNQEVVYKKYYNVGIATDTDQGLVVPVVFDADRKNMYHIAGEIRDLATRGREGKLKLDELKGSTISITNIGSAGGMYFTPIINFPETAILGTGRIAEKPIVKEGEIVIGKVMALSLSFDHRVIDGATAQYAMNYIKQLLEDPELLMMEV